MHPIAAFLSRFRNIRPPKEAVAKNVSEAIEACLKVRVDPSQIDIRGKTAFVAGPSALKSELTLRREELLAEIQRLGSALEDVR